MQVKKSGILNSFALKIIAILAMVTDHVAFGFISPSSNTFLIMRVIGRLAFVLFAFFISEGAVHTKNPHKYLQRLATIYVVVLSLIVGAYLFDHSLQFQNVFLTLLSGASLLVYFHHKLYKQWHLLIIPSLTIVINIVFFFNPLPLIKIFSGEYGNYGIALIVIFYLARLFANYFIKITSEKYLLPLDVGVLAEKKQLIYNVFTVIGLFIVSAIWYVLSTIYIGFAMFKFQTWSLLATIPLLLYNGTLGHNSKGWRTFYYLFYPLHVMIIGLLLLLI